VGSFSWRTGVSVFNFLQYALLVIVVAALVKRLGGYMALASVVRKRFSIPCCVQWNG
jgi:hypothetical protein